MLVHFQTRAFSLFPEMCFGPESSKYDEQKLCREPNLIQDKQGFDYKYDSGRPWPPNSLICLPRLQTVSPSKPARCRSGGPLWPALPRTEGVACKLSQLLHHLQCLRAAWSMSSKPELVHTWQVRISVHKVRSTRNATSLFSWCHLTKLKHPPQIPTLPPRLHRSSWRLQELRPVYGRQARAEGTSGPLLFGSFKNPVPNFFQQCIFLIEI